MVRQATPAEFGAARFVRRLVAERRVPFHKLGKYVRFDPRDIDHYLAAQRVEARL